MRTALLDFEWSDECIDFIKMFFFLCLETLSKKSASIFNFNFFSGRKINLVDTLVGKGEGVQS
jgi:hypothetical protein